MADKTVIQFTHHYGGYNPGEIAGVSPHVAKLLVEGTPSYAKYKEEPKAKAQVAPSVNKMVEAPQVAKDPAEPLESLTNRELRERLQEQGKPIYGSKGQLIERLLGEEE